MADGKSGGSPVAIAKALKSISYPAKKQGLIEHARQNNAERDVIEALEQVPEKEYGNMADVEKSVSGAR